MGAQKRGILNQSFTPGSTIRASSWSYKENAYATAASTNRSRAPLHVHLTFTTSCVRSHNGALSALVARTEQEVPGAKNTHGQPVTSACSTATVDTKGLKVKYLKSKCCFSK